MLAKVCPNCHQASYSSGEYGSWYCPYCGAELTGEPAMPAGSVPADEQASL